MMQDKNVFEIFFLCCLFVFFGSCISEEKAKHIAEPYKFTSESCSPKMRPSERAQTCQIPQDVLKGISTKDLVETVLDYPFFATDVLSANNVQSGFESVAKHFKGLQELLARKDAGLELIKKYQSANLACFANNSPENAEDDYIFKFYYLEILLAQDKIMAGLNEAQKAELKKEILRKCGIKQTMKECYGGGFNREVMGLLEKVFKNTLCDKEK